MTELPTMDMSVVNMIKRSIENIRNDIDPFGSANDVADLVDDYKLVGKEAYKPLLRSFCDLLTEKGFPQTASFLMKQWRL